MLTALAEASSPQLVLAAVGKRLADKATPPPVHKAALAWIETSTVEFGALALGPAVLSALLAAELQRTTTDLKDPAIKASLVTLVGSVHQQLGSGMKAALVHDGLPAKLKENLIAEIERQGYDPDGVKAAISRVGKAVTAEEAAAAAAGVPKFSFSKEIGKGIADRLSEGAWKKRAAALDDIVAACRKGGRSSVAKSKGVKKALDAVVGRLVR